MLAASIQMCGSHGDQYIFFFSLSHKINPFTGEKTEAEDRNLPLS